MAHYFQRKHDHDHDQFRLQSLRLCHSCVLVQLVAELVQACPMEVVLRRPLLLEIAFSNGEDRILKRVRIVENGMEEIDREHDAKRISPSL
jgi:hypothetical protein